MVSVHHVVDQKPFFTVTYSVYFFFSVYWESTNCTEYYLSHYAEKPTAETTSIFPTKIDVSAAVFSAPYINPHGYILKDFLLVMCIIWLSNIFFLATGLIIREPIRCHTYYVYLVVIEYFFFSDRANQGVIRCPTYYRRSYDNMFRFVFFTRLEKKKLQFKWWNSFLKSCVAFILKGLGKCESV